MTSLDEELIQIGVKKSPKIQNTEFISDSLIPIKNKNSSVKIWLADLTHTNEKIISDNIPYGIGCVASFAEKILEFKNPIKLFKYPNTLNEALKNDDVPNIIGFSNYVWNCELSLVFAKKIKEQYPEIIIVFGGPNYPLTKSEQKQFLINNPQIDFYIPKEGELAFTNLITFLINSNFDKSKVKNNLRSVHSQNNNETFLTEELPRLPNLSLAPSPYLTGKLDEFFDGKLVPLIQTNRGCPFKCTFCDEGFSYYNTVSRRERLEIDDELDYIGKKMMQVHKKNGRNDLRIADSNFGMFREDLATCEVLANCIKEYGWPDDILSDTGKNQQDRVLKAAEMVGGILRLKGSVQSLDPDVMKNIKRDNISSGDLMEVAIQASTEDISSVSELILCLPGETRKSHFESVFKIVDAQFSLVTIYQLGVEPGAEMFTAENLQQYGLKTGIRIMAECLGNYEIFDEKITIAELEKICYETNAMSFDDYISCRKLHLIVSIFYNTFSLYANNRVSHPFFDSILSFLRLQKIPISKWLMLLQKEEMQDKLKEAFESFEKANRDELWQNEEELKTFIQKPEIVGHYISGRLGYNLLHTFRILIFTRYIDQLEEFVQFTLRKLLKENQKDTPENLQFIDDAVKFESSQVKNILKNIDQTPQITLKYDILKFKDDKQKTSISNYKLQKPITIKFILDDKQKRAIKQSIQNMDDDLLNKIGNTTRTSALPNDSVFSKSASNMSEVFLRKPTIFY